MSVLIGKKIEPMEIKLTGIESQLSIFCGPFQSGMVVLTIGGQSCQVSVGQLKAAMELCERPFGQNHKLTPPR